MDNTQLNELSIGEIVTSDFRASTVFMEAGIDFCCGGKQNLSEACLEKGIEKETVLKKLQNLENEPISHTLNFKDWELGFLCDYIVNTHHSFVKAKMPELVFYTSKIASVHGEHHPELIEVADLFDKINKELTQHMKNEEEVLFPAIKEVITSGGAKSKGVIASEIERLFAEHDFAGGTMDHINKITKSYLLPEDACNTYQVSFKLLHQFEDDLHVHVHLENNILFPKALELAK